MRPQYPARAANCVFWLISAMNRVFRRLTLNAPGGTRKAGKVGYGWPQTPVAVTSAMPVPRTIRAPANTSGRSSDGANRWKSVEPFGSRGLSAATFLSTFGFIYTYFYFRESPNGFASIPLTPSVIVTVCPPATVFHCWIRPFGHRTSTLSGLWRRSQPEVKGEPNRK